MVTVARRDLDERIADAQEQLAKNAIADPMSTPQFQRLRAAKEAREHADADYNSALEAWLELIKHAPAAWRALAPRL